MSLVTPRAGKQRRLDRPATPDEQVTEDQVQDPARLTRIFLGLLRDVSALKRRWAPPFIEFEDFEFDDTGTTVYRFPHKLGGRVRWWVVDWTGAADGARLVRHSSSTSDTLCLVSYEVGTATIRVEVAG